MRPRTIALGLVVEALMKSRPCQACGGMGFHGEQGRWEQTCLTCGGSGVAPKPAEKPPPPT